MAGLDNPQWSTQCPQLPFGVGLQSQVQPYSSAQVLESTVLALQLLCLALEIYY